MLGCLAISMANVHFCLELQTRTSSNLRTSRIDWPGVRQIRSPTVFRSIPYIRLIIKFKIDFEICLPTCIILCETHPISPPSMPGTSLLPYSLRPQKWITLSVPMVKTNTAARAFCSSSTSWRTYPASPHRPQTAQDRQGNVWLNTPCHCRTVRCPVKGWMSCIIHLMTNGSHTLARAQLGKIGRNLSMNGVGSPAAPAPVWPSSTAMWHGWGPGRSSQCPSARYLALRQIFYEFAGLVVWTSCQPDLSHPSWL